MVKRYNFVVDLLTEEQHRELHEWYVKTGVIEESKQSEEIEVIQKTEQNEEIEKPTKPKKKQYKPRKNKKLEKSKTENNSESINL